MFCSYNNFKYFSFNLLSLTIPVLNEMYQHTPYYSITLSCHEAPPPSVQPALLSSGDSSLDARELRTSKAATSLLRRDSRLPSTPIPLNVHSTYHTCITMSLLLYVDYLLLIQ